MTKSFSDDFFCPIATLFPIFSIQWSWELHDADAIFEKLPHCNDCHLLQGICAFNHFTHAKIIEPFFIMLLILHEQKFANIINVFINILCN